MVFQDGAIYRAPDGKRYRARQEVRRSAPDPAWVLVPTELSDRDADSEIGKLLFVEKGMIARFNMDKGLAIEETGWRVDDMVLEP